VSDLKSLVQNDFHSALNQHNLDQLMGLFADDVVFTTDTPLPGLLREYRGKKDIRSLLNTVLPGLVIESKHFHEHEGKSVTWYSEISCDAFRKMNLDFLETTWEALVEGKKIKALKPTLARTSILKIQKSA
jgi:hypothetical protein